MKGKVDRSCNEFRVVSYKLNWNSNGLSSLHLHLWKPTWTVVFVLKMDVFFSKAIYQKLISKF